MSSSDDGGFSEEDEGDPELAQLMKENSDIDSSSSERESEDSDNETAFKRPRKSRRPFNDHKYEGMSSTLAVLMLGCWTCRIPALYKDFTQ
jgi:RNA polymerase I-specific transcription initiation factor RRN7